MRTITQNIYQFSELSPKAQQKAIDLFLEKSGPITDIWWKNIYDDALETADLKIRGFEIDLRSINCYFTTDAKSSALRVISEHGKDCTTYSIAKNFLSELAALELQEDTALTEVKLQELEDDYIDALSNEYLNILEREYEDLQSDDAIIEHFDSNDWEFYEDGRRYKS